ncbi:hypothetical protein V8E52_004691 [Russula decolorans]
MLTDSWQQATLVAFRNIHGPSVVPSLKRQSPDWSASWLSGGQVQDDLTALKCDPSLIWSYESYREPLPCGHRSSSLDMKSAWPCRTVCRWRIAPFRFGKKKTNQVFFGMDHWAPQELNENETGQLTPPHCDMPDETIHSFIREWRHLNLVRVMRRRGRTPKTLTCGGPVSTMRSWFPLASPSVTYGFCAHGYFCTTLQIIR